jgi:hypothetical protein
LTAVNGGYTVKYPVVPLESGEKRWQFPFASFDPEKGTYQVASPEISCTVMPGNTAVSTPVSGEPEVSGNMPPENSKTIPFELMPPADRISLPLADNIFYPAAAAILIILISAVKLLIPAKKPAPLKSALRKLAAEIAASDDWQELLRGENCAVIAEALKLPPGSTCAEIAGKADDPEIREIFLELDRRRFSPGEAGGASGGSERRKLLEFIGRLSLYVLLFALPLTGNAADFDTAMQYFANGDYPASAGIFRAAADEDGSVDPAMLYNTGCAEYMQGNYPAAWLAFTRASLLEPLNDDYARAVEKTTARLPDMPQFTNRFLLTPCGYALLFLFAGAAIIFPAAFIPACRRKFMLWAWLPAVIAIFAAVMAVKLHQGAYSPANAVVVRHDAQLSALPVGSGGSRTALPVGSTLLITGESGDFYQVRCGGTGGWVRKHDAERVFPYELF